MAIGYPPRADAWQWLGNNRRQLPVETRFIASWARGRIKRRLDDGIMDFSIDNVELSSEGQTVNSSNALTFNTTLDLGGWSVSGGGIETNYHAHDNRMEVYMPTSVGHISNTYNCFQNIENIFEMDIDRRQPYSNSMAVVLINPVTNAQLGYFLTSGGGPMHINIPFTPTSSTFEVRILNAGGYTLIDNIEVWYDRIVIHNVCDNSKDYRYGFNGHEKDNEVSGTGNSYTAEFWQYDPRLGRRWNTDPVVRAWESPYATFSNNPILFIDPKGDEFVNAHDEEKEQAENDVSDKRERRNGLRDRIAELKNIDPEERTNAQNKELRKTERQERKADRKLVRAETRLMEVEGKWEIANSVLKEFQETNPNLYGQWDRRSEKIVVRGEFGTIAMEDNMGRTTGYTAEGTDLFQNNRKTNKKIAVIRIYAPYSTVVDGTQEKMQIERNTFLLLHALGHVNNVVFGAEPNTEPNADKYGKENYLDKK